MDLANRYQKKPVQVDAVFYSGDNYDEVLTFMDVTRDDFENGEMDGGPFVIETAEGDLWVYPGTWVIRGVEGELYPCKASVFDATYEKVVG